jgi:hypothetical protein
MKSSRAISVMLFSYLPCKTSYVKRKRAAVEPHGTGHVLVRHMVCIATAELCDAARTPTLIAKKKPRGLARGSHGR